jgi:hypothetical protein
MQLGCPGKKNLTRATRVPLFSVQLPSERWDGDCVLSYGMHNSFDRIHQSMERRSLAGHSPLPE